MKKIKDFLCVTVATGFFSGLIPLAPGTMGSILALLFFLIIPLTTTNVIYLIVVSIFLGLLTITRTEIWLGSSPDYRDGTRIRDQ